MTAGELLAALASRSRIPCRVALVAAHPDDETIGAGASLRLFADVLLIHVTDGAPRDLRDAMACGHATASSYAAARRRELQAALKAGGATPETAELHVPDQGASARMDAIAEELAALFARHCTELVLTHAYEGGHPDHDATAFAVHTALRRVSAPATVIEMSGYHRAPDGGMAIGTFLRNGVPHTTVALDPAEQARKRRMLECFVSQRATLAPFGITQEAFRPAPDYDFSVPPHPGTLHYERYDWGMTGSRWRLMARDALAALAV